MTTAELIAVLLRIDPNGAMPARCVIAVDTRACSIVGVGFDAADRAVNLYCKREPGNVIGADAPTDRH